MPAAGANVTNVLSPAFAFGILAVVAGLGRAIGGRVRGPHRIEGEGGTGVRRSASLDALRGVLCTAVLVHDAAITSDYLAGGGWGVAHERFYDALGPAAIGLFFSLSAFLFWSAALAGRAEPGVGAFLRARAARLGPVFVVAGLLAQAVVASRPHRAGEWVGRLGGLCLIGLRPWEAAGTPDAFTANAQVTWTLAYQWGFYFAFPTLARLARGTAGRLLFVPMGLMVMFGSGPWLLFGPGVLAAYAVRDDRLARRAAGPAGTCAVAVGLAAFVLLAGRADWTTLVPTTLVFVPVACGNTVVGLLRSRGLQAIGLVSYGVYLLHGPVLYLARPVLTVARADGSAGLYWAIVAACATLTVLASAAVRHCVELPAIRLERRTRTDGVTAAAVPDFVPAGGGLA